jgi:hypothetical protein
MTLIYGDSFGIRERSANGVGGDIEQIARARSDRPEIMSK